MHRFIYLLLCLVLLSCEEEFTPDIPQQENFVIEGYIQGGEVTTPAYVIISQSVGFFDEINADVISGLYVNDATVIVKGNGLVDTLDYVCLDNLPPVQKAQVNTFLGFGENGSAANVCFYMSDIITGVLGNSYSLEVQYKGKQYLSNTTIPNHQGLESLYWKPAGNMDTLIQLYCTVNDDGSMPNYYRYQTQRNDEPLYPAAGGSVFNDKLVNGSIFDFPVGRGQNRQSEVDVDSYGLFSYGDTVLVKWNTIDEAHFDFWNTLEFNTQSQGPFSSFTKIKSNIQGEQVLGVWGGYANSLHTIVLPEN